MRYVRRAESLDEHNLNLHQMGKCLYFTARRKIRPGEELKAWYSDSYARARNLPPIISRRKHMKNRSSIVNEMFTEKENISEPSMSAISER